MTGRLRRSVAAFVALFVLIGVALPAGAASDKVQDRTDSVPPTVDLLLLRPVAMFTLVTGTAVFAVSVPFVLITRPQDIGKPFEHLVVRPAKYIWVDPVGVH